MKKKSKASIMRYWGLPDKFRSSDLRYKDPIQKGIYWYWFSLEVRKRDVEKFGTCISCGKRITVETAQAGHFMPASSCGRDLLFDPLNVNAECGPCNAWDGTHLLGYADNLDKRYGQGTAVSLRNRREQYRKGPPLKDWKGSEYAEKIRSLTVYPHATVQRCTDDEV